MSRSCRLRELCATGKFPIFRRLFISVLIFEIESCFYGVTGLNALPSSPALLLLKRRGERRSGEAAGSGLLLLLLLLCALL